MDRNELATYDLIIVNSSGGKDSQVQLDVVVNMAGPDLLERIVVVHSDLGRVEWQGTKELAEAQARHYGVRFEIVKRPQGDLLDHVEQRGMWPSSKQRYCTSDHKRGQVATIITKLVKELDLTRQARVLQCFGMRAEESPARAKLPEFENDKRNTNGRRHVDRWLPIHDWKVDQVWERIRATGVPYHRAYDIGMPRLSCCFCIFAPEQALLLAGKHNPELLRQYVEVEQRIGHSFKQNAPISLIAEKLAAGIDPEPVQDWTM